MMRDPRKKQVGVRPPMPTRVFRALLVWIGLVLVGHVGLWFVLGFLQQPFQGGLARSLLILQILPLFLGALVAQGMVLGAPVRLTFGFRLARPRYLLISWLAPLVILMGTLAINLVPIVMESISHVLPMPFSEVSFVTEREALLSHVSTNVAPASRAAFREHMHASTLHPLLQHLLLGMLFGGTVGACFAWLTECVWRGFLFSHIYPYKGFFYASVLTGIAMWISLAPLVYYGHIYGVERQSRTLVLFFFFCLALAPYACGLRLVSGSSLPPAIYYSVLVSLSTFPPLVLRAGEGGTLTPSSFALLRGMFGVAGILSLILFTFVCFLVLLVRRKVLSGHLPKIRARLFRKSLERRGVSRGSS